MQTISMDMLQRILDCHRTLSVRTGWKKLLLVIAAPLLGMALAGLLGTECQGMNDGEKSTDANSDPAKSSAQPVAEKSISGVVLKPDGTPAGGAIVRTGVPVSVTLERRMGRQFRAKIHETTADANGRFSTSIRENLYADTEGLKEQWKNQKNSTVVAASLPGFGPAWLPFEEIEADQPVTLQLVDDVTIRGQVVDLEGTPVRGTTVTLAGAFGMKGNDLTEFFSMLKQVPIIFKQPAAVLKRQGLRAIDANLIGLPEKLTTDQDGRLEIKGLGKERLLHLAFTGGDVAFRVVTVATREMESIQPQFASRSISEPILGLQFQLAVAPSRPVEGVIVDADTRQPLSDINIEIAPNSDHRLMKFVSDQHGRFRIMGLAKGARTLLKFLTKDDRPYFPLSMLAPDPPGIEPVELNVELHRGIWIKGKVTDKVTRAPVVGVNLHYYPLLSNEYAARVPAFRQGGNMDNDGNRYQSDSSGSYRIIGLPGPAIVGAENDFMCYRPGVGFEQFQSADRQDRRLPTWRNLSGPSVNQTFVVQRIDPGIDAKEVHVDLELDPGLSTTIRIVDQQGNLVKGVSIYGTGLRYPLDHFGNFADGMATVDNLGPDETRILHASHADRNLGLMIRLQPPYEGAGTKEFILQPLATITGRLFEAGESMDRLAIISTYRDELATVQVNSPVLTNAEGRFRMGLIPGHEYELEAQGSPGRRMGQRSIRIPGKLNVQAGEAIDLGDFELDQDGFRPMKPKAAETKDAVDKKPESPAAKTSAPAPAAPIPSPNRDQANTGDADQPKVAPALDAKSADEIIVAGVVLKPDGSPAARAIIRSAAPVSNQLFARIGRQVCPKINEVIADENGRFVISVDKAPYGDLINLEPSWQDYWTGTPIVASLEGFGPAWRKFSELESGRPVTLRLVEDAPVRGQVVDLEANPVRGTSVSISRVRATADEHLTQLIDSLRRRGTSIFNQPPEIQRQFFGLHDVEARLICLPEKISTDNEGWFEIRGLGKERVIHLVFDGGDVGYRRQTVLNRVMEPFRLDDSRNRRPMETETFYGSKFTIAVSAARPIDGVVVDAVTGKPVIGAMIGIQDRLEDRTVGQVMQTLSDQAGHFRLMGVPKAAGKELIVLPPTDQPYFPYHIAVPDPDGLEPVKMKIELHRGLWIQGRVTDKITRQPVPGVAVHYFPYLKNEFVAGISAFKNSPQMDNDHDRYLTDLNGFYRLIGLPGRGVVGARSAFQRFRFGAGFGELKNPDDLSSDQLPTFKLFRDPHPASTHVVRAINPTVEQAEVRLDLELDPGDLITIRLVDDQGKLATGIHVFGLQTFGPNVQPRMPGPPRNQDDSIMTIENLGTNEKRTFHAYHSERELGLKLALEPPYEPGAVKEFVVQPVAIVTGRLLDEGKPLHGLNVTRSHASEDGRRVTMSFGPVITTNAEGRFRMTLIPGYEYSIDVRELAQKGLSAPTVATKLNVRPGETIDLGDFELDKNGFRPVKPPVADKKE